MKASSAKQKIEQLAQELHLHNHKYYVLNAPEISDKQFDLLLKELEVLEKEYPEYALENSPTKRVGGDITEKFKTIAHKTPMLSLSNSYSFEEIDAFYKRAIKILGREDISLCGELKYDGVAISVHYKNGSLNYAVTRGDGTKGEDVTLNVRTIKSIPLVLQGKDYPDEFEVRGEIFLPHSEFDRINKERANNEEQLYANPRNTASGTLKLLDSTVVAHRNLDCFLYSYYGPSIADNQFTCIQKLKTWGFKTPPVTDKFLSQIETPEQLAQFVAYWQKNRTSLPFDTDGLVFKVNQFSYQEELGYTAKSPRWAIAYKFETERVSSILKEVTYQVGRTGAITPVANLEPVLLGGTTVKRASLHNQDQIEKLDLFIGDEVYVEKGGEIIPKIVGVNLDSRTAEQQLKVIFISHCPDCNTELVRTEGEAQHYCPNAEECPTQVKGRLEHFISKKALNIEGIGHETIDELFKLELVKNPADLYTLSYDKLINIERFAEKSVQNLLDGLEKSKQTEFAKVLYGLGIRYVGETVAKKLAKSAKSIDQILSYSIDDLVAIPEIGGRIAESVYSYFQNPLNIKLIERLSAIGFKLFVAENDSVRQENKLLIGKSLVISGTFTKVSRDDLKKVIEALGGNVKSGVSKNVDILVAGENMGHSKLEKAKALEVTILSEDEFFTEFKMGIDNYFKE